MVRLFRLATTLGLLGSASAIAQLPATAHAVDPKPIGVPAPGEVLVVGEVHGSNEIPAAFLALVDQTAKRANRVSVGLELPDTAGAAGCEGGGPLGSFWTRKEQDGRSSRAMREMVCQLKNRASSGRVRLVYLDTVPRNPDEMVRRLSREVVSTSNPMLVLIGNFHARNAPNSFTDRARAAGLRVTSLTASATDATTWNCGPEGCGVRATPMEFCPGTSTDGYLLVTGPAGLGWDGCIVLPRLTSSPPVASGVEPQSSS